MKPSDARGNEADIGPSDRPLQAALASPPLERGGGLLNLAPQYVGLFLWVVYLRPARAVDAGDRRPGPFDPGRGGGGIALRLAALLRPGHVGDEDGPADDRRRVQHVRGPGGDVGPVRADGLVQVVWFAVATYYATELTLRGLVAGRLLDPRHLAPVALGGLTLKSPLFLVTSLFWSYAAALVGYYLVGVIAALMKVFPVFMALSLMLAALLTLGGVTADRPPLDRGGVGRRRWPPGIRPDDPAGLRVLRHRRRGVGRLGGGGSRRSRRPARRLGGGRPGLLDHGDPRAADRRGGLGTDRPPLRRGRAWRPKGRSVFDGPWRSGSAVASGVSSCSSSAWRRWPPPVTPRTGSATASGRSGPGCRGSRGS